MKRTGEVKQAVKTEVWETIQRAAANPLPTADKSPIWVMTNMNMKNGQYMEYMDRVKKLQPVFQESANAGNGMGETSQTRFRFFLRRKRRFFLLGQQKIKPLLMGGRRLEIYYFFGVHPGDEG